MATEATIDISNEATATSEPELTAKLDDSHSRNVDYDGPDVNGVTHAAPLDEIENKHITDIVEDLVNSAEVSVSGGSDTEASRHELSRLKDEEKGHGRTSSTAKKATTFKSVSVNKTFLAAKGTGGATPVKSTDKAAAPSGLASTQAGSAAANARPRLVAKTGSGLRDSLPRSGANGGRPAAAPDPNVVWNKNRPPEPKKFTDEELKKYGIHMATRLQSDDPHGQANNWADIEDDDEDWAPEAITWTDGTKIAIPHVEEHATPPVSVSPAPPPAVTEVKAIEQKPKSPAPSGSPSTRPGVPATAKSLVLKGAPEKPTLVAKPPAPPTPVKSPWAAIPKIDKASPIVMDLPSQPAGGRFLPRELQGANSVTPPPLPKEIAADDFSRAPWRDGSGYGSKELFNSQSGRYEPVTDRRALARTDAPVRQPAVLQRSSQAEQQGPAEPSAAFQTHRMSGQEAPYGRRRNSSNVSGGSGSFLHRYGKPLDAPPHSGPQELLVGGRRGSVTGGSDSPASPRNFSPSGQQGDGPGKQAPWQPRASPATLHSTPFQASASQAPPDAKFVPPTQQALPNAAGAPDDYEYQKKLMRERREMAMKRRLEEEAKAEAEKQERIRLKLEALGPAPERKSMKKETGKDDAASAGKAGDVASSVSLDTQSAADDTAAPAAAGSSQAALQAGEPMEGLTNGVPPQILGRKPQQARAAAEDAAQPADPMQPPPGWTAGQSDRFPPSSWVSGAQSSGGNVWGAPNNDRTLGNGTFSLGLGRVSDAAASQPAQAGGSRGPGPIAPPKYARDGVREPDDVPARLPPIGPPARPRPGGMSDTVRNARASAWVNAVQHDDAALNSSLKAQREEEARRREAEGISLAQAQATITDKWRPVKLSEEGRRIEETKRQVAVHGARPAWNVHSSESSKAAEANAAVDPAAAGTRHEAAAASLLGANGPAAPPVRTQTSRFFPSRDIRLDPSYNPEIARPGSPSPPPPDTVGHPAFDGDVEHPHVALPPPQPVVRLPPAQAAPAGAPGLPKPHGSQANFSWANPAPYKEPESPSSAMPSRPGGRAKEGGDWQARFDTLTGRVKPTGPSSRPAAVDSVSRNTWEHASSSSQPAPVSLPRVPALKRASESEKSVTTRAMAEDCFDQQEMGSLPPVRIPKKVPDNAWQPAHAPSPHPRVQQRIRVTVLTVEPWDGDQGESGEIRILFPFMAPSDSKVVTLPFTRSRSNPRRGSRGGPRAAPHAHRGAPKGDQASSGNASTPASPARGGRGGGGGYRARSENWPRHSTPLRS